MTVINKSSILASGKHIEFKTLYDRYKKCVQNTKHFNGSFIKVKSTKVGNGEKTEVYSKKTGKLLQEWYIISDRFGYDLGYVTYKEVSWETAQ